jgi:hypothetical protein
VVATVSPRPVQCRSGEPNDRELFGRVYRQAWCATSCLDPDEWFPLTADVRRAREQATPGHRDLRRVSSAGGLPGAFAPALFGIGAHGMWGGLVAEERREPRRRRLAGVFSR